MPTTNPTDSEMDLLSGAIMQLREKLSSGLLPAADLIRIVLFAAEHRDLIKPDANPDWPELAGISAVTTPIIDYWLLANASERRLLIDHVSVWIGCHMPSVPVRFVGGPSFNLEDPAIDPSLN